MFDFSKQIEAFWNENVRLSATFKDKLLKHRQSNRDRLIANLPEQIDDVTIGKSSFKPQGSMAMKTIIQTRFSEEEYDIDDGLVLWKSELIEENGKELTAMDTKERVCKALKDKRFNRQPKLHTNCVRVFYADEDEEKHHVDFAVYRKYSKSDGEEERELASGENWVVSDPTQVNLWFEDEIVVLNKETDGKGTQMRKLVQLLKRFCRSRKDWDLPNGMKLTMLISECQSEFSERIDKAFRDLLKKLKTRLETSKIIRNLAHPDKPLITRTSSDDNVCELLNKIIEALENLEKLDDEDCKRTDANKAWNWVFKSDDFFDDFDGGDDEGNGSKGPKSSSGLASSIPSSPVDHQGGGRFG
jgi:hypothetical protein